MVYIRVALVNADRNHVRTLTDAEFFVLNISNNWTTLLDADTGVHKGAKNDKIVLGIIFKIKLRNTPKYTPKHPKVMVFSFPEYLKTR